MSARHVLPALVLLMPLQAAASSLVTLFDFATGRVGVQPQGQIVLDKSGHVFGIVLDGGTGGIYEVSQRGLGRTGHADLLWQFSAGPIGVDAAPGLVAGAGHSFLGATDANNFGENAGCGSVYALKIAGKTGAVASVRHLNERACGAAGPVNVARNGDVFVIAVNGGTDTYGSIIRLKPRQGEARYGEKLLYSFTGKADGFYPGQPMLLSASGSLYGTALASSNGQVYPTPVFQLSPPAGGGSAWAFSLIWQFPASDCADGVGQMIEGPSGTIYAPCSDYVDGNGNEPGNIFSLTPPGAGSTSWTKQVLYSFAGGQDGGHPHTGLVLDGQGNLYGTTSDGDGTIFRLSPPKSGQGPWTKTTLWTFSGGDGTTPSSPLVLTPQGTLIGTTARGGIKDAGTLFELTP